MLVSGFELEVVWNSSTTTLCWLFKLYSSKHKIPKILDEKVWMAAAKFHPAEFQVQGVSCLPEIFIFIGGNLCWSSFEGFSSTGAAVLYAYPKPFTL